MTNDQSLHDLLHFEAPAAQPRGWETAEAQAFRFPLRYAAKCREFNDYARGLEAVEKEKNQLFDFVVRNLIAAMDTLQFVFEEIGSDATDAAPAPTAGVEAETALAEAASPEPVVASAEEPVGEPRESVAPEGGETSSTELSDDAASHVELIAPEAVLNVEPAITRRALESIRRSLMNILEGLHIEPVDLLGRTYRSVEVNGRVIEDPFEIVEARHQGKATELPVLEVITSLWVQTEPGVRVIRKGQVIC